MCFTPGIEKPGRAAPSRRNAFTNEALSFGGAGWKFARRIGGKFGFSHVGKPFSGSSLLLWQVVHVPGIVLMRSHIMAGLQEAILITR